MNEQWRELKETITEMRDNDGTGTQQEVCKFLVNLMDVLEKQMSNQNKGDLISREQAIKQCGFGMTSLLIADCLRRLPSVSVSENPNKGEWIESKERSKHWYCSVCGGIHTDPETGKWRETFDYRYSFCPNCGADMRGEE